MRISYKAVGKVQGVMFRQTVIRACLKRNIDAGATNNPDGTVSVTFEGDEGMISEIVIFLKSKKEMNSWGALPESFEQLEEVIAIENHQVSTDNVDTFNWSPNVEFYL